MNASLLINFLTVAIPYVLPVIISLVAVLYKSLSARLPANLQAIEAQLATRAVLAVEQSMSGAGSDAKFAAASDFLSAALSSMHVSLLAAQIKPLIEEAVFYLNEHQVQSGQKEAPISTANHGSVNDAGTAPVIGFVAPAAPASIPAL